MDKKVLNEINRSREIMGLKQLVIKEVEKSKGRLLTEQEMTNLEVWLPAFLQDVREPFWKYLKSHEFNTMKYGKSGVSLAKAIAHAYKKIHGEDMNLDSLHIYKDEYLTPYRVQSYKANKTGGYGGGLNPKPSEFGGTDLMVLSNPPGSSNYEVTMTFAPLGWDETEVSLDDAINKINEYNILKAGQVQITNIMVDVTNEDSRAAGKNWTISRTWKATSLVNQLIAKKLTGHLVLFSPSDTVTQIEGEGGGTITIAADVVTIPGDQAFEDVKVEPNPNVVKKALDELVTQANGKPVKTIEIHSSASDDTIQDPEEFRTNFPQYRNWGDEVIQKKDKIGPFTANDLTVHNEKSGNRALALMRGHNVGKLVQDIDLFKNADIEYVYSIGNKGDDSQFANLLIKAMEDDTIEVLKGGTTSKSSTKTNTRSLASQSLSYGEGGKYWKQIDNQLEENLIDVYKAVFWFDLNPLTKQQKRIKINVRKKKLWPPSEWFKGKDHPDRQEKEVIGYDEVEDTALTDILKDRMTREKEKQDAGEL